MATGQKAALSDIERAAVQILISRELSSYVDQLNRHLMSVQDLKEALRHVPGIETLTIRQGSDGDQIVSIRGRAVSLKADATPAEIEAAFATPLPPNQFVTTRQAMSITGASSLKAKFEAAKARKAAIEQRAENAVKQYNDAGDIAEGAIKKLEDDAQALLAEVKDFSNGAPE
jgi:mevalonate kinase